MADSATTDPADQDPISQTFTAGNALNAKNFIDYQFQMGNQSFQDSQRSVRDLDEYRSELRAYKLKSMERADVLYAQSMAMVTAVNTAAASALIGGTGITSVAQGQEQVKTAQSTPPDTATLSTLSAQVAGLLASFQALVNQGAQSGTVVAAK